MAAQRTGSRDYMTKEYAAYQQQYRRNPRESDKKLMALLAEHITRSGLLCKPLRVLDVGCHNGNLLAHLRRRFPELRLSGCDIFEDVLEQCRADPELSEVTFALVDILDMRVNEPQDVVILNGLLFRFSDEELERAWRNVYAALRPGGVALVFDYYTSFRQTIRIVEETERHPDGLIINIRSQQIMRRLLQTIGFNHIKFEPFEIPIDLPFPADEDANKTYTCRTVNGHKLQFRGSLFQPWCHLLARRRAGE